MHASRKGWLPGRTNWLARSVRRAMDAFEVNRRLLTPALAMSFFFPDFLSKKQTLAQCLEGSPHTLFAPQLYDDPMRRASLPKQPTFRIRHMPSDYFFLFPWPSLTRSCPISNSAVIILIRLHNLHWFGIATLHVQYEMCLGYWVDPRLTKSCSSCCPDKHHRCED